MSHYELQQLIRMWEQEKLTSEQVVGQILLHLQAITVRVGQVEQQLDASRRKRRKEIRD